MWRMPLIEDLKDQLKSDSADLKHTGDRWGGSISAALFLREFVGNVANWIHCDIAGPAMGDRVRGRSVRDTAGVRRASQSRLRRIADVAIPLVVGLWLCSLVLDFATPEHGPWLAGAGALVAIGQGVALYWRRSHPLAVMAIALAGGLVVHLLAPEGVFPVAGLIAIGSLAAARPPLQSVPALAALLGLTALNFGTSPAEDAQFAMAFPVVAWALGEAARNRRVAIAEESRRAVGEEQARIARELHDVIAHSVSVIVVQAAAADDVFDERPDQARAALRSIETAGREALGELRRLLGAVGDPPQDAPPPPQPGWTAWRSSRSRCAPPVSRWR